MRLPISGQELAALIVAVSFAAGLNVYATLATLGLLAHTGVVPLPGGLQMLGSWWVIGVSAALFAVEFFADKIPAFDLIWNALHTFIRIPAAALMAYAASAQLSPVQKLLVTLAAGLIAAIAHSSKTAARVVVTPSPEPLSNIALSATEDVGAIGLTWLATHHPLATGITVGAASLALIATLRYSYRRLHAVFTRPRGKPGLAVRQP
jgi:hypothetical protein